MAIRQVKIRGRKRWQARGAYQGARASRLCDSRDAAKQAEAEILQSLTTDAEQAGEENAAPATLALLCDCYLLDLEARGKPARGVARERSTQQTFLEFLGPRKQEPIGKLTEADLFAFRLSRVQRGIKPSTINREFRMIRAVLRRVMPEFRLPGKLFFPEDESRVRWLEPVQDIDVMSRLKSPFREMAELAKLTMMR